MKKWVKDALAHDGITFASREEEDAYVQREREEADERLAEQSRQRAHMADQAHAEQRHFEVISEQLAQKEAREGTMRGAFARHLAEQAREREAERANQAPPQREAKEEAQMQTAVTNVAAVKRCFTAKNALDEDVRVWHVVIWSEGTGKILDVLYGLETYASMQRSELSSRLRKCQTEAEVESAVEEIYSAILVSPSEFYEYIDGKVKFSDLLEKKIYSVLEALRQSCTEGDLYQIESQFQGWLFKGLKKFGSKATERFLASDFEALWREFQTDSPHYLFQANEDEVRYQAELIAEIRELLTEEKFEAYLGSFGNGYVLSSTQFFRQTFQSFFSKIVILFELYRRHVF